MVDSAELIKKVRFPRQLVAFSMVATQAVTFAVMIAILIVLSLVFVPEARSTVWARDPARRALRRAGRGLALLVACLNVLFRDVEHILTAALLPVVLPDADPLVGRDAARRARRATTTLLDVLRWGNPVAPPIFAVRDALWSGHLPRARGRRLPRGRRRRSRSCSAPRLQRASTTASRSSSDRGTRSPRRCCGVGTRS